MIESLDKERLLQIIVVNSDTHIPMGELRQLRDAIYDAGWRPVEGIK